MDLKQERGADRLADEGSMVDGLWLIAAGGLLIAVVVTVELAMSGRSLSAEWPPATGAGYLLRSLSLATASLVLVVGARRAIISTTNPIPPRGCDGPVALGPIGVGMVPAIASAALLVADPTTLSSLVREDGPIEWASAGLAFGAVGLYAAAAVAHGRRARDRTSMVTVTALVAAAGAALLLGLEEISWFQRVFDVESPEFMLNRNGQQELNLHNLATGLTGNAYFVGGFVVCCALPFFLGDRGLPSWLAPVQSLIPNRTLLLATATSSAVVYEMWNIVWIQLTFWLTMAMLTVMATTAQPGTARTAARVVFTVSLVVAAVFLIDGDSMVRSWDDTEVREVIIPYGLVLAAYGSLRRAGRDQPPG